MIKHDVPFFSQKTHITDPEWQLKGCGVTALKMILEHWKSTDHQNQSPGIAELITASDPVQAFVPNVGWSHFGLVKLASQFGYVGHNQDLIQISTRDAWKRLLHDLTSYPIIASVRPKFDPASTGGHLVTLTGFDGKNVALNDPDEATIKAGVKNMSLETFLNSWKKRYIVIYPNQI